MDERIAVNFRGRSLKNPRLDAFCQTEHIDRAHDARFDGFDRIILIMNRRSRTRQVIDLVDFQKDRLGYVVANQFETAIIHQMIDIFLSSGEKIVETNYFVAFPKKPFAKM